MEVKATVRLSCFKDVQYVCYCLALKLSTLDHDTASDSLMMITSDDCMASKVCGYVCLQPVATRRERGARAMHRTR